MEAQGKIENGVGWEAVENPGKTNQPVSNDSGTTLSR